MATDSADGGGGRAEGRARVALVGLVVVAAVVRVLAASDDLWVDELFSLRAAGLVRSPWEVFTAIHSDNNHYLNTLWMYFCGQAAGGMVYRLPAVVCGVAAVAAAYWSLMARGVAERLMFAALVAGSMLLVVYSSEARGYSGAMLAAIVAYGAARRWVWGRSAGMEILFAVACVGGILSHLTFVFVWGALAVWIVAEVGRLRGWRAALGETALLQAVPAVCLLVLYWMDLRFLEQLGGPKLGRGRVLGELMAWTFGWPGDWRWGGWVAGMAAVVLMALGVARERGRAWIFYAVLFGAPAVLLLVRPPVYLFPRYFLVLVPFMYRLVAGALAGWMGTRRGRVSAAVVGGLWVVGEVLLNAGFLAVGRGNPSAAVAYMSTHTAGADIAITSVDRARALVELAYFNRLLPAGKRFVFLEDASQGSPRWLLLHGEPGAAAPRRQVLDGVTWVKAGQWDASPVSGQVWVVYGREGAAGTP